jgi:dolichol-phosphate mannosyltransferase
MENATAGRALVVMPTYNERENIVRTTRDVLALGLPLDILVVDDSSPDGTADVVRELQANEPRLHLLVRSAKEGLGAAYVAGFRWALERDYAFVFEMDADYSHDPKYLPGFLAAIQDADLVLGSRYKDGKINVVNWDIKRLILSYGGNIYARMVTGLPISDATGGFKCFRRSALEALDLGKISSGGYSFQIELTYKLWRKGLRIAEIPIVFTDREAGVSKMSGKIIREALFVLLKIRFGRG